MKGFIVGLGKMGRMHFHAMAASGIDVLLGFDSAEEMAQSFAAETGVSALSIGHLEAEVVRYAPEFVSVATTTPSRYGVIKSLLKHEAIKFVFVEKPFSSSLAQMSDIILESSRRQKTLAINHQMMFLPHYVRIRDLIAGGEMGELVSMSVSGANFGLANKVSHYFEAFRYLTGSRIARVSALLDGENIGSHRGAEFRDFSGRVTAWNAGEQVLFVDFSAKNRIGIFVTYNFEFGKVFVDEIKGRAFSARMSAGLDKTLHIPYPAQQDLEELTFEPSGIEVGTTRVVRAVLRGEEFPGMETIQNSMEAMVASVYSSRQNGNVVSLTREALSGMWDEEFAWS